LFQIACTRGHIPVIQWLQSNIQWLFNLDEVNIHADSDRTFRDACMDDRILVAQWLFSLGGIDIHFNNNNNDEIF
jgi:hypothetical protein